MCIKKENGKGQFICSIGFVNGTGSNKVLLFWQHSSDLARYYLLATSIKIVEDHFPIGAGLGTFGSYMSAIHFHHCMRYMEFQM